MLRALTTTILGLILGTAALFLEGVLIWGYYSASTASRALSLIFGWPFVAAQVIFPESVTGVAAIIVNYSFYIFLAWLLLRRLRRAPAAA